MSVLFGIVGIIAVVAGITGALIEHARCGKGTTVLAYVLSVVLGAFVIGNAANTEIEQRRLRDVTFQQAIREVSTTGRTRVNAELLTSEQKAHLAETFLWSPGTVEAECLNHTK